MTPEQKKAIEDQISILLVKWQTAISTDELIRESAEFGFHLRDEEVERLNKDFEDAKAYIKDVRIELDTLKKQVEELKGLLKRCYPYIHDFENTHDPSVGLYADKELDALQKELATYITDNQ